MRRNLPSRRQVMQSLKMDGKEDRGEVQTPFVPAARKFFLPQWVAFDDAGKLLVGSVKEAEAHIQSMQRYVMILHRALSLAPYISANEEYQKARLGRICSIICRWVICDCVRWADRRQMVGRWMDGANLFWRPGHCRQRHAHLTNWLP